MVSNRYEISRPKVIISTYLDSRNFNHVDVVSSHPTMIVDLHAVNGLNLSDVAVGHGLEATFDGGQAATLFEDRVGWTGQ